MLFFKELYEDAKNILNKDPASRNVIEVIILYSPSSIIPSSIWSKIYKIKTLFSAKAVVLLSD